MNLLTPDQQMELLRKVLALTTSGKLEWGESDDPKIYAADVGEKYLYNVMSRDGDDVAPFAFHIYDKTKGEDASAVASVETVRYGSANELLEELYTAAKRDAINADALVEDIFSQLKTLEDT
ncbi:hypothetical protein DFO47_10651 [Arthrobacter sp. AG258]|uniref:hypothetical protein n=1 Tax=Arthrobacter sp. AG258 TaxID=2183899 RepID=UPI00105D8630|nr:hypothetical protein [Arthrobacter sp. AG258]TDT78658.1 hypothetical protein DFO47_10651 [Arthrobacter sp. AG258]